MQNQINPQFLYQPTQWQQPAAQGYSVTPNNPSASVGAVNIQIFNPTANPAPATGFYQQNPCAPYPCNYNNLIAQSPYPAPSDQIKAEQAPMMNQKLDMNKENNGAPIQGDGEEAKKTEEKDEKDKKPKVALTDEYIMTLENYLNSPDKKIRLMGAKELFERFKEDETRKDDAALTALLNKTLQDPAETVKFVALTALDSGYATGNNETAQILTQMQSSNSGYGDDASLASQILLKMSGYKANADTEAQQTGQNAQIQDMNQAQPIVGDQAMMQQAQMPQNVQQNQMTESGQNLVQAALDNSQIQTIPQEQAVMQQGTNGETV